mgnify:CR=1 FL=1
MITFSYETPPLTWEDVCHHCQHLYAPIKAKSEEIKDRFNADLKIVITSVPMLTSSSSLVALKRELAVKAPTGIE